MNVNWPRWTRASFNVAFVNAISTESGLPLFIEGTDRRTEKLPAYAELRLSGPSVTELSRGYFQLDLMVDVLVCTKRNDGDIYAHDRSIQSALSAFTTNVSVFQFGDDPSVLVGCYVLLPRSKESIAITNFGQVDPTVRMFQSTIEATYRLCLYED